MGCCQGGSADEERNEPLVGKGKPAASKGKSGVPTGTKWDDIQKDRERYQDVDEDAPELPMQMAKQVNAEIDLQVKQSKYLVAYKKEFRDALKRKKAKGHEPRLFRLWDKSLWPADEAAGKSEDRKALRERIAKDLLAVAKEELIEGFKEDGLGLSDAQMEAKAVNQMRKLVHERMNDAIYDWAERCFKRDQQGKNPDESDPEQERDEDERIKRREERKRQLLAEREAEAEEFKQQQAETAAGRGGSAGSPKSPSSGRQPPPLTAPKRGAKLDPAFKQKCVDFYKHYAPDKVAGLDEQLAKRQGDKARLDEMWKKMVEKYGPWPPEKGGGSKKKPPAGGGGGDGAAAPAASEPGGEGKENKRHQPPQVQAAPAAPQIDNSLKLKGGCGELPPPPPGVVNRDTRHQSADHTDLKGKSPLTQARLKRSNASVDCVRAQVSA
eukprot:TRINITY_DN18139_c0_g1_i1.p1 TRINITY_DN18139_c0_g1~~TRINITY_DN18139_c0_g1_i1.p1  ORF type:complete len:439 (+),score=174.94 TRINITY_DN18139_c0_g1_i1:90-1406(+)